MNIKRLIDMIYPSGYSCINCSTEIFDDETRLCDDCKTKLPYLVGNLCVHCSDIITGSGKYCLHCKGKKFECAKIVSPFAYDGIVKKFIVSLKYENKKYYAESLARYMSYCFIKENLPCDLVTCVPLCDKRLKTRKYNQAELIASNFAKFINKDFDAHILKRVKETPSQTKLTSLQRRKNILDAFKVVDKKKVKDKVIVIVDDVYTTGATMSECAKVLNKAGAVVVYGVTAGRTLLKNEKDKKK